MAVLEFLTGLMALVTAALMAVLIVSGKRKADKIERRAAEIQQKAHDIERKTDEIHVLVNSRLTAVLDRVEQLTQVLQAEDVDVPAAPRADKHLR